MELTIVALSILLGLTIIGLVGIVIVQMVIVSKDKRELEKLLKARSLQEFAQYVPQEEEEEEEEGDGFVPIEQMGEYMNKEE